MNNLIDRMIMRVQRPISPVEPLLTQLYAPRPNGLVDSEVNSAPAIESRHQVHPHPISKQVNASRLQVQQAQDAPVAQPFRQSTEHLLTNTRRRDHLSDSVISESRAPAPTLSMREASPSTPTQLYESDSPRTQPHRRAQSTTKNTQDIPKEEYTRLGSTRLAPLTSQNESTRRTERNVDKSITQNQLRPAPTTEVNISIGHIEVRAIQRTEPVRRSVSPSHVTLDDYLRRRSGA